MKNTRHLLILAGMSLAGVVLLSFYTVSLSYEELRDWQVVEVVVDNVGGLKELDEVQIRGSRQGRVVKIELYKSRQRITLEVVPGLTLHKGTRVAGENGKPDVDRGRWAIEIVPKNALGAMAVRITPGDPETPAIDLTRLLEASLREGVGVGDPSPGRREAIRDSFATLAAQTKALRSPDSGAVGAVLFDSQRVQDMRNSLNEVDQQWVQIDRVLAEIEAEQGMGRFLLSTDTLVAVGDTIEAAKDVLFRTRAGLSAADSGDEASGGWLGDPTRATEVREALAFQAETWDAVRKGEGLLGRALDPSLATELEDQLAPLHEAAAEGVEERGLLGVLSGEAIGEWTRNTTANLPRSLERIRYGSAENPESARQLKDAGGNVDDALINFRRGMTYVKRGLLPARTSFANALFMVF